MFEAILEPVGAWVIDLISRLGYLGIIIAMGIESACIPLPSEIIMPFSGYLVFAGRFSLWGVSVAGAFGCVVGSVVGVVVGLVVGVVVGSDVGVLVGSDVGVLVGVGVGV